MPSFAKKSRDPEGGGLADAFSGENINDVLQNAKNDARARVKELIQNVIPEYIRHLNDILEAAETDSSSALWKGHLKTGLFVKDNVKLVYNNAQKRQLGLGTASIAPEGTDGDDAVARQRWEGGLEQNVICDRLNAIVEEEAEKSYDIGRELYHWLKLEVPIMEDGNNFGVDVQDELIRRVDSVADAAHTHRGLPKSHYDDRMKLAMQWNKFPNLKDHPAAIANSDRQDFFLLRHAIMATRANMVSLLTALRNNWSKAHNPKDAQHASAVESMY